MLEAYAMTEASHQMCSNPLPSVGPRKPGTVGTAQGGVKVAILDLQNRWMRLMLLLLLVLQMAVLTCCCTGGCNRSCTCPLLFKSSRLLCTHGDLLRAGVA